MRTQGICCLKAAKTGKLRKILFTMGQAVRMRISLILQPVFELAPVIIKLD